MNRQQHLLVKLAEECNEVAHRVAKALRFGLDHEHEGSTNRNKISGELMDLRVVADMLEMEGVLDGKFPCRFMERQAKIEKYLSYSRQVGTLVD